MDVKKLIDDLQQVFGVKVRDSLPSKDFEQDVMFISFPEPSKTTFSQDIMRSIVPVNAVIRSNKLKHGWMQKKIMIADSKLTNKFFFESPSWIDSQQDGIQNVITWEIKLRYFYSEQFNKPTGNIEGYENKE